jgi:hypothetical protein
LFGTVALSDPALGFGLCCFLIFFARVLLSLRAVFLAGVAKPNDDDSDREYASFGIAGVWPVLRRR